MKASLPVSQMGYCASGVIGRASGERILVIMGRGSGKIIIESGANVWPHEMDTARAFAAAGHTVEFIRRREGKRVTAADAVIDGVVWEMKSPESHQVKVIEKNIRIALHQSRDVIFDSRRMKNLSNEQIEREVRKWAFRLSSVRRLYYVRRDGEVVKIK